MTSRSKWIVFGSTVGCMALIGVLACEPYASAALRNTQHPFVQDQAEPETSGSPIGFGGPPTLAGSAFSSRTTLWAPQQTQGNTQSNISSGQNPSLVSGRFPGFMQVQSTGGGFVGQTGLTTSQINRLPGLVTSLSPEELEKQQETMRLLEAIREAKDDEDQSKPLVAELETVLSDHFDIRMESREAELEQLEERISRLRDELNERRSSKREIVELRLLSLVNEAMGLGF